MRVQGVSISSYSYVAPFGIRCPIFYVRRNSIRSYCGNPHIDYNKKILHSIEELPLRFPTKITSPQDCDYIEITDFNGLAIGTRYVYVEQLDEMFKVTVRLFVDCIQSY